MKKTPKKKLDKIELSPEERALFLEAFFNGSLLENCKEPKNIKDNVDEQELFLNAVKQGVKAVFKKDDTEKKETGDRNKKSPPKLDLHGVHAEDAVSLLLNFIDSEKQKGSKTLLVIHGKGTGVLKQVVWSTIEHMPTIDDYQVAPGKLGGAGAVLIKINRKRKR